MAAVAVGCVSLVMSGFAFANTNTNGNIGRNAGMGPKQGCEMRSEGFVKKQGQGMEIRLQKLMTEGKITQGQADAFKAGVTKMRAQHQQGKEEHRAKMQGMTQEERQAYRADMKKANQESRKADRVALVKECGMAPELVNELFPNHDKGGKQQGYRQHKQMNKKEIGKQGAQHDERMKAWVASGKITQDEAAKLDAYQQKRMADGKQMKRDGTGSNRDNRLADMSKETGISEARLAEIFANMTRGGRQGK